MGLVTGFARTVTTVNRWIARIMHWVVLALFALLLWDVVMRYVADSPIQWSQQLSRLLFGVYAILGGGYLLARREHVNVDLFYANFSRRRQALVDIVTSFLFFLLLFTLLPKSIEMARESVCMVEGRAALVQMGGRRAGDLAGAALAVEVHDRRGGRAVAGAGHRQVDRRHHDRHGRRGRRGSLRPDHRWRCGEGRCLSCWRSISRSRSSG